jgi:hypothetical protein
MRENIVMKVEQVWIFICIEALIAMKLGIKN